MIAGLKALKHTFHTESVDIAEKSISCPKRKTRDLPPPDRFSMWPVPETSAKKAMNTQELSDILKVILSYDYLWMNLRVKGGAYGCMSGFKRSGESYFVSYRDPHLKRTLDVYEGIPAYVRDFQADEREMTKYIIGTISGKDVPRTPQMQGSISKTAWFCGVTEEMMQKERNQILGADVEDIRGLAPLIEAILSDDAVCVVGSETAIEKEREIFKEVKSLISC